MSTKEYQIYGFSLFIIFGCGVAPSLIYSDWTWLERSGSLLSVFGIFMAFKDYTKDIDEEKTKFLQHIDMLTNAKRRSLERKNPEDKKEQLSELEYHRNTLTTEMEKLQAEINIKIRKIEVGLIIVGTLIWGYGSAFV